MVHFLRNSRIFDFFDKFLALQQTKDAHTNPMPLGHIYRNISHDGGQWKTRSDSRRNQQEIEKNRATPHHENDPESALPKPKKPSDQNEISKYAGPSCQRVLRADVPAVNRWEGTSSSKEVTQDHKIIRNIGKRADYQNEVSAIL